MSTRKKLALTIIVVFGFSILASIFFASLSRQHVRLFSEYSRSHIKGANDAIKELNETYIYWVAHDYTLWDELIKSIQHRDDAWLKENLGNILYWFDLEGVWVLNSEREVVFTDIAGCATDFDTASIEQEVFNILHQKNIIDYYVTAKDSLMLVQAATIHPTEDHERKSEPSGYMFLAKCWDNKLVSLLDTLTGCELELHITDRDGTFDIQRNKTAVAIPYNNWQDEAIAYLVYTKRVDFVDLLRRNFNVLLFLLIAAILSGLLIFSFAIRKWVIKPLNYIAEIISSNKTDKIPELKKASSDFSKIGTLIEDFIEQKEALKAEKERAEESDRLKSAFLANMSHEIRTPLNGILGFVELLDQQQLTDLQRKKYTSIIGKSGQRLLNTINDILEISMIEAGQAVVRLSNVNTEEIMQYCENFFKQQANEKGLVFVLRQHLIARQAVVETDRNKLEGIITNLLKNAIKFTDSGGVYFGNYLEDNLLVFYVKDTGCGIPADRIEHVFDRFTQVDMELTRKHEGSGLGLSIVKSYVDMLGGKIWVESEPGNGSMFSFAIPYRQVNEDQH